VKLEVIVEGLTAGLGFLGKGSEFPPTS